MNAGVNARVGHNRGQDAERYPAAGQAAPTPVANANADAECPEGHEVELGIATRRANRDVVRLRSGGAGYSAA